MIAVVMITVSLSVPPSEVSAQVIIAQSMRVAMLQTEDAAQVLVPKTSSHGLIRELASGMKKVCGGTGAASTVLYVCRKKAAPRATETRKTDKR